MMNTDTWKSNDGGQTFTEFAIPHGDNHDLWIDPANPQRMIEGNDGGACVTYNGGATWSSLRNQPMAERDHVTTDTPTPYRLPGEQPDNTTISVPTRDPLVARTNSDDGEMGGGGSGDIRGRPAA